MDKMIIHIDFDSFFASVEQQFDPQLRNRPLGVTATNCRTCIIASSKEAKRLGIGTGSRTYEAKKICPDLILVPADFVKYFEVSKKFINICKDYSPLVELFSIDELFLDITPTVHLFKGADGIVSIIKKRIREEIGEYITTSFGISYNKLLAKLAAGLKKPNGIFEIKLEDLDKVYKSAKLTDICGIGERIADRLNKMGIMTLLDLRNISGDRLVAEFGKAEAQFLKNISEGKDNSQITPYTLAPDVKSIGRNYCLPKNEYDKRKILQNTYELWEEISIKLRRLDKKARTLGFSLRGNINIQKRKTYSFYFDDSKEVFHLFESLLSDSKKMFFAKDSYIRQISVWVANFEKKENLSLSFFDSPKKNSLMSAIDSINQRFGDHAIRNGFLLYADKLTTVPNGYLGDRYERTKLAKDL